MAFRKFPIILVFLVMAACFSSGQTQSGSGTGIEGVITFGPTKAGPIRADTPGSKPLANATFVVENEKGKKRGIGRFGPFPVDVVAGQMSRVTWECDTGIR